MAGTTVLGVSGDPPRRKIFLNTMDFNPLLLMDGDFTFPGPSDGTGPGAGGAGAGTGTSGATTGSNGPMDADNHQVLLAFLYAYLTQNGMALAARALLAETKHAPHDLYSIKDEFHRLHRQLELDEFLVEWWTLLWSMHSSINPGMNQILVPGGAGAGPGASQGGPDASQGLAGPPMGFPNGPNGPNGPMTNGPGLANGLNGHSGPMGPGLAGPAMAQYQQQMRLQQMRLQQQQLQHQQHQHQHGSLQMFLQSPVLAAGRPDQRKLVRQPGQPGPQGQPQNQLQGQGGPGQGQLQGQAGPGGPGGPGRGQRPSQPAMTPQQQFLMRQQMMLRQKGAGPPMAQGPLGQDPTALGQGQGPGQMSQGPGPGPGQMKRAKDRASQLRQGGLPAGPAPTGPQSQALAPGLGGQGTQAGQAPGPGPGPGQQAQMQMVQPYQGQMGQMGQIPPQMAQQMGTVPQQMGQMGQMPGQQPMPGPMDQGPGPNMMMMNQSDDKSNFMNDSNMFLESDWFSSMGAGPGF